MCSTLAILTIGVFAYDELLPLLTDHISESQITPFSLLAKMTREEVMATYAADSDEDVLITLLNDNQLATVSRQKIERDIQAIIQVLDKQGFNVILLMSTAPFTGLKAHKATLIEPQRIIPPLVNSIVEGHQMGVVVPIPELMSNQYVKWQGLQNPPYYALANPIHGTDEDLIAAGKQLIDRGADVLMLDCLGFYQRHRDLLQKTLDIPVLLSNVLLARLAAELLI